MGQRNSGVGRAGERRRHARHDLEADAVLDEALEFLAAAPEHERVAALEPHHAPPARSVLDHQRMDLLLRDTVPATTLADLDELRLAARERQDLRRDQPVVQYDVGCLQRAQRIQSQEARVTRPGTDQHHGSCDRCGRRVQRIRHPPRGLARSRGADQRGGRPVQQPFVEAAARTQVRQRRLDARAPLTEEVRQATDRVIDRGLDPLAHEAREHGRRALRRNRDHERRAIDDRRQDAGRELEVVDDVGDDAACLGRLRDRAVRRAIVRGGDREPGAVEVGRREGARAVLDAALRGGARERRCQSWRHEPDAGAGFGQQCELALRDAAAAHDDDESPAKVEEQGEVPHGRSPAVFRWPARPGCRCVPTATGSRRSVRRRCARRRRP